MVGHPITARPDRRAAIAYRTLIKTLSATLFAGALLTIIVTAFGVPFGTQAEIALLGLSICAAMPIIFFWFWRQQKLEKLNAELYSLAFKDPILGCLNRRGFATSTQTALASASLEHPCTLLVVDVDNMKRLNDNFGYLEGDAALHAIVAAIRTCIRTTDVIGRLGGEEFGILLAGADATRARIIAARISTAVANAAFLPDGRSYQLSVSIGGAVADTSSNFAEIFAAADKHLFAAKKLGRNRVAFTTPEPAEPDIAKKAENAA